MVRRMFFSSGKSRNLLLRRTKFWSRSMHRPSMHSSGGASLCRGLSSPDFGGGLFEPKNKTIGVDLAGRVEAVGGAVKQFRPGDEVFGIRRGAFAEYVCA